MTQSAGRSLPPIGARSLFRFRYFSERAVRGTRATAEMCLLRSLYVFVAPREYVFHPMAQD